MTLVVYDVSDHALLSAKAAALKEEKMVEQTAWAAELLGVAETTYTGNALTKVRRALALQINYQLLINDHLEMFFKKSTGSGASKQSVVYRDGVSLIFPMSAALVGEAQDDSGGWKDCTSLRRQVV